MTTRLGPVQRATLLVLSDGTVRSTERVEMDGMLSAGRAYSALMALARRGYVDRDATSGHGVMLWSLSDEGQTLAEQVHRLNGDEEDEAPRCPHGQRIGEPPFCKRCRVGLWACSGCVDLVRGGERGPHQREHKARNELIPTFTWARDA